MSLRKGLALLLLMAFGLTSLVPASAAVTISATNTTSSTLEVYVLPGNSANGTTLVTQGINTEDQTNQAAKSYDTLTLANVGNGGASVNNVTLSAYVTSLGKQLTTDLQPGVKGGNQTQNWNVVVCETTATGFLNGEDFFFALPSGWDLNLENGTVATGAENGTVFTVATSNGVSLSAVAAGDVQEKSTTVRAGVSTHINAAPDGSTSNRDCFAINLQHENVVAPAAGSATTANLYTYNTTTNTTNGIIAAAGSTNGTDLTFVPSIVDKVVDIAFANGNDLINNFLRTGSSLTAGTTTRTAAEKIAAGAIQQTGFTTPTSITRYRSLKSGETTAVHGIVLTESSAGAWNLINGPTPTRPSVTLFNEATDNGYTANGVTLALNGAKMVMICETNGITAHLNGTPVVTPLSTDIDVDAATVGSDGELSFNFAPRSGSLTDPNEVASRILVQGLTFSDVAGSTSTSAGTIECFARVQRLSKHNDNGNAMVETIGAAEAAEDGTTDVFLTANSLVTDASNGQTFDRWAASQGVASGTTTVLNANGSSAAAGNAAFFAAFDGTTVGGASVANGTTALKTVTSTTEYGVTVADLPTDASASGDTDKLITVTVAQNSLSAGIPVTLDTQSTTNDGIANSITGNADADGGITLAVRGKVGQTLKLSGPALSGNSAAELEIVVDENGTSITPSFTSTAVTSELDGADGYVQRGGKVLLVFTITSANTVGFDFADEVANAKVNGAEVFRFGTTDKYGTLVSPGAGSYTLALTVGTTDLTKSITLGTAVTAITTTSFKAHGKMKLKDKRSSKGRFNFRPSKRRFLESTRVFEVDADGVVTESVVTLRKKRKIARVADASDSTEFVCITSPRQSDCFDVR